MKRTLEVCCGSLQSVTNAVEGGAERIELCSALSLDGLTPSMGLLKTVRTLYPALKIHVLIRPREGDFVYANEEIDVMVRDIEAALPYADGIVIGALTAEGDIDMVAMRRLMDAVQHAAPNAQPPVPVTFHRAFDACRDPFVAMEQIIELGCRRILTSGQQPRAIDGIDLLRQLRDLSDERLIIMPGGGVNPQNAHDIVCQVQTTEIHGSCSGSQGVTSSDVVRQVLAVI